jgi:hypothetical protein
VYYSEAAEQQHPTPPNTTQHHPTPNDSARAIVPLHTTRMVSTTGPNRKLVRYSVSVFGVFQRCTRVTSSPLLHYQSRRLPCCGPFAYQLSCVFHLVSHHSLLLSLLCASCVCSCSASRALVSLIHHLSLLQSSDCRVFFIIASSVAWRQPVDLVHTLLSWFSLLCLCV